MKEWENEPDFLEWTHGDFHCVIVRNIGIGNLCGYVGVVKEHDTYDFADSWDYLKVHGGITFNGQLDAGKSDYLYVGFDCAHFDDLLPFQYEIRKALSFTMSGTYRNIEFVKKEIEGLVKQIESYSYISDILVDGY